MGGRALNIYGVHTVRKNTEEFIRIGNEIQKQLDIDLQLSSNVVTCYHTKSDHGDLDLLIQINSNQEINWRNYIQLTFSPNAINNNGGVYSFDYQNFQIDFILIKESNWEIAKTYFSYDPLGNIMGKTFHKFGLSYGWNGLFYKYRNFDGRLTGNIFLSNDPKPIFEFGGYDYDKYLLGFETLEDIIKFTINSKYFDYQNFQMNNLNSIDKKRNRKRGSYNIFLKYLEDNQINITYPFDMNKENYIKLIDLSFPEAKLLENLTNLQKIDTQKKIISQKFNGDIVMSWLPKLQGKELGKKISDFKKYIESDGTNFDQFILLSSFFEIKERFVEANQEHFYIEDNEE